jgi:hypothetical protein
VTFTFPRFSVPARCADEDPELWFPDKASTSAPAKRICNGDDDRPPCAAREECLAWALAHTEAGVWGGRSERQRKAMRVYQAGLPPQCGSTGGYRQHLKRKETPCEPCRQANAEYCRNYRRTRRGAA